MHPLSNCCMFHSIPDASIRQVSNICFRISDFMTIFFHGWDINVDMIIIQQYYQGFKNRRYPQPWSGQHVIFQLIFPAMRQCDLEKGTFFFFFAPWFLQRELPKRAFDHSRCSKTKACLSRRDFPGHTLVPLTFQASIKPCQGCFLGVDA